MTVLEQVSLAPYTTFRLGGPARYFVGVKTIDELQDALNFARDNNQKVLILGGGSNMLVGERGFDGLVIKLELTGVERESDVLIAAAGENWNKLVERAVQDELWGIENLSGIPGTVGAAPVQNIGAYGVELKDIFVWLEALELASGEVKRFEKDECGFGYRTSIFKREGGYVILKVALQLRQGGSPNTAYKDLAGAEGFSLQEIRERVLAIRAQKFPDLAVEGTAGSFFLNPIVSEEQAAALTARFPELPHFRAEGGTKLSLAWLFDKALSIKGLSVGGARVFERQPLVLVATRAARAADVRELSTQIKDISSKTLGLQLEEEVRMYF